jgi:hypothetical protein
MVATFDGAIAIACCGNLLSGAREFAEAARIAVARQLDFVCVVTCVHLRGLINGFPHCPLLRLGRLLPPCWSIRSLRVPPVAATLRQSAPEEDNHPAGQSGLRQQGMGHDGSEVRSSYRSCWMGQAVDH